MNKQILILALLVNGSGLAAVDNVRMLGATHAQAELGYTAPSVSACTVEVSRQPSLTPLVHDVNPALFAGAGSDGGGARARVYTVGLMTVGTALDGKNYSRSLQAATLHYYRITCGGDTATGTFQTRNIPLGMTYTPNPPVDGVSGKWKIPTVSWTDRTQEFVDPLTGALLKRTVLARDYPDEFPSLEVSGGTGAAWTSPGNIVAADSIYASYSGTAQDKLAAQVLNVVRSAYVWLDAIQVDVKGYGTGSTTALRTIQICLSVDGTTCAGTTNDLVLPSTNGTVTYNASATLGDFMGWPVPSIKDIQNGLIRMLIWKKPTSGSDTIFIDVVKVRWKQSRTGGPTSGGFHDVCSQVDSAGWTQCVINGNLYGIRTTDGLVRTLGILGFLNISIPELVPSGGNLCGSFGDGSRLWHSTNPNTVFCPAPLAAGGTTLVQFTTDSTNADKGQDIPDNWASLTNHLTILPAAYSLETLLFQFDPTLPPLFNCGFDVIQGNYVLGTCRAGQQDTYAYTYAFSLGDGTAVGSAGCGTVSDGKCQTSGVGVVAVNKVFNKPVCRWCTFHTLHSQGPVPIMSYEVQAAGGSLYYGNSPGLVTLTASLDGTQTNMSVTSAWVTGAQSRPGTITSSGTEVTGTGTTFPTDTTVGDTICAGGQCRVVAAVLYNEGLTVTAAFSPNITGQAWTNQWSAAPGAYQAGEPVSQKFPHFLQTIAVGDYLQIENEKVRVTAKASSTSWTIARGCSYWEGPCTGTGASHSSGLSAKTICPANTLDGYALAYYWDFVSDPTAADSNINNPSNSGGHALAGVGQPYGFSGAHQTVRGQFRIMTGYDIMGTSNGINNRTAWGKASNYPISMGFYFAGKFSPNGGNTYQRHPSNQQLKNGSDAQYNFFTDVTPFIGGTNFVQPSTPSTQIEGTLYRVGTPDSNTNPEPRPTRKYLPTLTMCGQNPLSDISGPSSHIVTSTTDYTYCYAEKNGECRGAGDTGGAATAGQHFLNCPTINTPYCTAGEVYAGANDTCIGNLTFEGNATVQFGLRFPPSEDTVISEGPKRSRVLAKLFHQPRYMPSTGNAKVLPNGSWVMHIGLTDISNAEMFLLKNPGMPPLDSTNRQTFQQVRLALHPPIGLAVHNAIVEFGYDDNLYCTSRAETCVSAASNNPYFFASESFSGVPCASGCVIDVPSIPSRVLRYRFAYRDVSNSVVRQSHIYSIAVP